jgi:anion-transporting  ArsA/GET3 family ATPase
MKWEYIVREFSVEDSDKILLLEEFLNEVGRDRWELISVATTPTASFTHLLYLKRATALTKPVDLPIGGL